MSRVPLVPMTSPAPPPPPPPTTVAGVFARAHHMVVTEPARTRGIVAGFTFLVDGALWHLAAANGTGTAGSGPLPEGTREDVRATLSGPDLIAIATGTLDAMTAYGSRRLQVRGNLMTAMKLRGILQ